MNLDGERVSGTLIPDRSVCKPENAEDVVFPAFFCEIVVFYLFFKVYEPVQKQKCGLYYQQRKQIC